MLLLAGALCGWAPVRLSRIGSENLTTFVHSPTRQNVQFGGGKPFATVTAMGAQIGGDARTLACDCR